MWLQKNKEIEKEKNTNAGNHSQSLNVLLENWMNLKSDWKKRKT